MDGAFCEFSEIEKIEYMERLQKNDVVNIEMECSAFAALTYHAGIKSAIVCVTFLDRLKHDQVRKTNFNFQIFKKTIDILFFYTLKLKKKNVIKA